MRQGAEVVLLAIFLLKWFVWFCQLLSRVYVSPTHTLLPLGLGLRIEDARARTCLKTPGKIPQTN